MANERLHNNYIIINGEKVLYQTALNDLSDLEKRKEANPASFSSTDEERLKNLSNSVKKERNALSTKDKIKRDTSAQGDKKGGNVNKDTHEKKPKPTFSSGSGIAKFGGTGSKSIYNQISTGTASYDKTLSEEIKNIKYLIDYMNNNKQK